MMDILCIGTAVMDISASSIPDRDKWEEKQRISKISLSLGGDAANQSVRLADFEWSCALVAATGEDVNGKALKEILHNRGVHTEYMVEKRGENTGTALVLVDESGNRNTFSVQGAHSKLERCDLPDLSELKPKVITIGSLFSLPLLEEEGLLEYLQEAKSLGIITCADLGSDKKQQGLAGIAKFLPYLDYFWPSDYDAGKMTMEETVEKAADVFLTYGCKNVVIKCGEKGCFYKSSEGQQGWIPALKIQPVDTTGAGDCMAALMVDQILLGKGLEEACRYACKGASISTLYRGASEEKLQK